MAEANEEAPVATDVTEEPQENAEEAKAATGGAEGAAASLFEVSKQERQME